MSSEADKDYGLLSRTSGIEETKSARFQRHLPASIGFQWLKAGWQDLFHRQRQADDADIVREHFAGLGCALFETAMSWWSSNERIRRITLMTGLEHLEAARATGRGVLLLSAHFNSIEIGCRALAARMPLNVMYRPTRNLLIGEFVHSRRAVQTRRAIRRDDVRTLVKALKEGDVVWYAPDQSFRKKGAEMVKLFGIPAATNTATSRIAQMTGALVMPYFFERLPHGGYRGTIHPPLENFPTDDAVADT